MTLSAAGSRITVKSEMADAPASRSRSTRGASSGLRTSPFSRSRPCALAASLLASLSATLLATSFAGAQGGGGGSEGVVPGCAVPCDGAGCLPRYHVRLIAKVGDSIAGAGLFDDRFWYPGGIPWSLGRVAWNASGEIAFTRDVGGVPRGAVWLPQAAYGLAAGVHDIEQVTGQECAGSFAWDIADDGTVVGGSIAAGEQWPRAMAWRLGRMGTGDDVAVPLDEGSPSSEWAWSMALSCPAQADTQGVIGVVGTGARQGCPTLLEPLSFEGLDGGAAPACTVLELAACDEPERAGVPELSGYDVSLNEWACDIAATAGPIAGSFSSPYDAVADGEEPPCPLPGCPSYGVGGNACPMPMIVGASFPADGGDVDAWFRIADDNADVTGLVSVTVDEDLGAIGAGWFGVDGSLCIAKTAGLWRFDAPGKPWAWSAQDVASWTGDAWDVQPLARDVARRFRRLGCGSTIEVMVGDQEGSAGIVWTSCPQSGQHELGCVGVDSLVAWPPRNLTGAVWTAEVTHLFDISSNGELLALVNVGVAAPASAASGVYVAVVGPYLDMDGDWVVGGAELAAVVGDWEPAGVAVFSPANLNVVDGIDGADLALVINHWGPCDPLRLPMGDGGVPNGFVELPLPDSPCPASPSLREGPRIETECLCCALARIGYPSVESFVEWARDTSPESLECMCACVRAVMEQVREEMSHE